MASDGSSPRSLVLDDDVRDAIEASHLRSLGPDVITHLTGDATRLTVPAGSTIHHHGNTAPHVEVVVSGLIRVYVTAPDGRNLTVRYCRPGALIGVVSLFASSFSLPATIQAVTDADLLVLRPAVVQRTAERDPALTRAAAGRSP